MKGQNDLTEREERAVREHYGDSLLLVESWNEFDEDTNERNRCLGILYANFRNEKFRAPKPYFTNVQRYEEKGDMCLFSSTDMNGNMVLRESKSGKITDILPGNLKEIIKVFRLKPKKIIISHRILDQS